MVTFSVDGRPYKPLHSTAWPGATRENKFIRRDRLFVREKRNVIERKLVNEDNQLSYSLLCYTCMMAEMRGEAILKEIKNYF